MGKKRKAGGLGNQGLQVDERTGSRKSSYEVLSRTPSADAGASQSAAEDRREQAPGRQELKAEEDTRLVSLVFPVFNEAKNIGELVMRCTQACTPMKRPFEIILVDDGSSDDSARIITEAAERDGSRVIGVLLNRNYGQHSAVMAGFAQSRGSIVVTLDADLQNPPEEIPKLVEAIDEGADVVGSVRMPRCDSFFRRISSLIVNKAAQKATGVIMHDYGCMLRAYRRHVVDAMLDCHERSTFIPVLANSFAHKTKEIEVQHERRRDGDSKYSLWKLINLQFDLLTSMTTFPLRVLSVVGAAVSLMGIGFGIFLLVMRLIYGAEWAAQGVFTLFAILFIFVGAQFVAMGLLGEYIGRIYYDVRGRPRYFVERVVGAGKAEHDIEEKKSPEDAV
jgi:undecaprenyl-phosphate 4-deoxy-4-formamido-L-arabinose transferase